MLLQALPDPNRARKEAFLLKYSSVISVPKFRDSNFSKLMKFTANAAIPDADEAIPELCGKVFLVSIVKW